MKVEKQKLEQLTEDAVRLAGMAMSMLFMLHCPVRQEYEKVESFLHQVEEVRNMIGLEPLTPEQLYLSKQPERRKIGFEIPALEG